MLNTKVTKSLKEKLQSAIDDASQKRFNLIWTIIENAIKKAGNNSNKLDVIHCVVKNTLRDGNPLFWDIEIKKLLNPIPFPKIPKLKGQFKVSSPSNNGNWFDSILSDDDGNSRGLIFNHNFTKICDDCKHLSPKDLIKCNHTNDKNNDRYINKNDDDENKNESRSDDDLPGLEEIENKSEVNADLPDLENFIKKE